MPSIIMPSANAVKLGQGHRWLNGTIFGPLFGLFNVKIKFISDDLMKFVHKLIKLN